MEKAKIKIKYSELSKKSKEELLKMKKDLQLHNLNFNNNFPKRPKGYNPHEVRKNIARINQLLKEK